MSSILLMNQYVPGGLSGGDKRFIEIIKRTDLEDIIIITSLAGKKICEENGIKAKYIVTSTEKKRLPMYIYIFLFLFRIIKATFFIVMIKNADLVYSSSDFLPDTVPSFFYKLKNKKSRWVQVIHHVVTHPSKRKGNMLKNILLYYEQKISFILINKKSDKIVVVNRIVLENLVRNNGFCKDKIKLSSNGVNIKYFKNIVRDNHKIFDCVFLGVCRRNKGIHELIDIWKLVVSKNSTLKLGIIGEIPNEEKNEIQNRIKKHNLQNNVLLLGNLPDNDAFYIIKNSSIFVFPSFEEGWGMVICEAMACGLPVITWDLPVYKDIYPKGRICIPLNDINAFSEAILNLLKNDMSYLKLSKEAEEIASDYDWSNVVKEELKILN